MDSEKMHIGLLRGRGRDRIVVLCTEDGLRALGETFLGLASGARSEAVVSAGAGVRCLEPLTLRAVAAPAPSEGGNTPMLARVLKRILRPGARRGLFRSGPREAPVFHWILEQPIWRDFAELVARLADAPRKGTFQRLDSDLPQDADVEVEYRERLTPAPAEGEREAAPEQEQ